MGRRALVWVLLCLVAGAASASASAAGWTAVTMPASRTGDVDSLSCASARVCFVLGNGSGFTGWNGAQLSAMPNPPLTEYSSTDGLACPSAQLCMSVGDRRGAPASAARWSRGRWTELSIRTDVAKVAGRFRHGFVISELQSIACPSATACVAVGGGLATRGRTLIDAPIIERYNGRSWRPMAAPGSEVLTSISCTSPRRCTAVGSEDLPTDNPRARPVALRMRGRRWSRLRVGPPVGFSATLSGVSCRRSGCVAVGAANRNRSLPGRPSLGPARGFVLSSQHGEWSDRVLPRPASTPNRAEELLDAVSCPPAATANCVAIGSWIVGDRPSHGLYATVGQVMTHQAPLVLDHGPTAIDCPTASFCLAGGNEAVERYHR